MRRFIGVLAIVGAICLAFPASAVQASVGQRVYLDVQTTLGSPSSGPFTASGMAVDTGLVCPDGDTVDVDVATTGVNPKGGAGFHVLKNFICSDGSGSFLAKLEVRVSPTRGSTYSWLIVGGTGAYTALRGSGTGYGLAADYGVHDILIGTLH